MSLTFIELKFLRNYGVRSGVNSLKLEAKVAVLSLPVTLLSGFTIVSIALGRLEGMPLKLSTNFEGVPGNVFSYSLHISSQQ